MKLSDLNDQQWFDRLSRRRAAQRPAIQAWWQYYDGEQPLYYVAKILAEQDDRFPPLLLNWSQKYVDGIDRRCNLEGFGYVGEDSIDESMQKMFLRNELDELQSENNIASLVTGVSYAMIGPSSEGARITIESPDSMAVEIDPSTGRVVAAIKGWATDLEQTIEDRAVLLLPNSSGGSRLVEFEYGRPAGETKQGWMNAASRAQTSPEIPVVPFLNRARQRRGYSQLRSLRPVVDAANQVATNMLAAVEHHAVPRKWALGVNEDSFKDADGNAIPAWKIATGAVWVNPIDADNPLAKPEIGQFASSDLRNFHDTMALLARLGAGLCNISPHELGFGVSDNPASADGIRASQDEKIGEVERIQGARGSAYERVMQIGLAVEGSAPAPDKLIQSRWRSASTPTKASLADAAVKTYSAGISDLYQARLDYGYSVTTIQAMEKREREFAADPFHLAVNAQNGVGNVAANPAPAGP